MSLRARAFAKINLGLEVLSRRADGYHELRTILQTIDFADELSLEESDGGIRLEVERPGVLDPSAARAAGESRSEEPRGWGPAALRDVPEGPDNLVHRAATRFREASGYRGGAVIQLEKRIPVGKGLGGGSSDAAAALLALDRLWGTRAALEDLHHLAAGIGMDVPFFLYGGTALAMGRGDEIHPLDLSLAFPIVLILPEFSISTAAAYGNYRLTNREPSHKLLHFARGLPKARVEVAELRNDLEEATGEHSESIQEYKRLLLDLGASSSMMSGSGSSVYGIFHDEASAASATRSPGLRGIQALATKTLDGDAFRAARLISAPFAQESNEEAS